MNSKGRKSKNKSESENQSHGNYMSEKIRKLNDQFRSDAPVNKEKCGTSTNIFRGVSIHVNGYTDPSSDELKRLMTVHGGMYIHYYSVTRVTHIIATNLPFAKLRQLRNEKIVKPEWITESIKAGRLLPSLPYELYTDRSSRQNQGVLQLPKGPQGTVHAPTTPGTSSDTLPVSEASTKDQEDDVINDDEEDSVLSDLPEGHDTEEGAAQRTGNRSFGMATAGDSNFLSEFYSNSRLHHISTWGAECKAYVNELQHKGETTLSGKQRLLEYIQEKRKAEKHKEEVTGNDFPGEDNDRDWCEDHDGIIRVRGSGCPQANGETNQGQSRWIMHIDMDCFFVSVGLIKHPHLVNKPVAVTHSKGQHGMSESQLEISQFEREFYEKKYGFEGDRKSKGAENSRVKGSTQDNQVTGKDTSSSSNSKPKETFYSMADIASCNYIARKAGVKNGMSMGKAKSLCPDLQTIPYDFDGYKRVSKNLYDIVASYTHDIEAVSCDEMFVDISGILRETGASADEFVQLLRQEIKEKTQCNASAGIASNILLARMATRVAKPNGQFILEPSAVLDFIKTQPVKDLPGVGRSTTRKMESLGINTCSELQELSLANIQKEFGQKTGQMLYGFCRGLDDRPIRQEQERKSVSAEVNYGIRFKQESDSEKFINELAAEVHKRLTGIKMLARSITVKLKARHPKAPKETSKFMGHGICEDKARSSTLGQATDDVQVIQKESRKLLKELQVPAVDMRGVGIQLSKLISSSQAGTTKSIAAFLKKPKLDNTAEPGVSRLRSPDASKTSPSSSASSDPKPKARTMLNFLSKRSEDSQGTSVNDTKRMDAASPRKKKVDVLPRLPSMPGPKGPQGSSIVLPSPSQIDMSVLQELPKDIQEQILASYKTQQPSTTSTSDIISEPSTSTGITDSSRWDHGVASSVPPHILDELIGDSQSEDTSSLGVVEALPSFSQIDPTCLEALPPELQEELRSAYRGKQLHVLRKIDPTCLEALPPELQEELRSAYRGKQPLHEPKSMTATGQRDSKADTRSPAKQSPSKSPFKIKKRGRPRKGSPHGKANNPKRPRWQMGIDELITRNQTPPKQAPGGGKVGSKSPPHPHHPGYVGGDGERREEEDEEKVGRKEEQEVNLCGAVHLWDVKVLLREWILSTDDPVDEDIGFIVQYLRELILEKNLEMVDLVIRSFSRSVKRLGSSVWMEAVDTVIERIQHTMGQIYNSRLKIVS